MKNKAKLLFVDDEISIIKAIRRIFFDSDYEIDFFTDPERAMCALKEKNYDVIITDYRMPQMSGLDVLINARTLWPESKRILMTGCMDIDVIVDAINEGNIFKYISKPWDNLTFRSIVQEAVEQRFKEKQSKELMHDVLRKNGEWKALVHKLEDKIYQINDQGINMLIKVIESKDKELMEHSRRVAEYGLKLASSLNLNKRSNSAIRYAAYFHDIGKIAIRDSVLYKEGSLDNQEYDEVMHHPKVGAEILLEMEFMKEIAEVVYQHHERFDGTGYPEGLKGPMITVEAGILGIADFYDALTSKRSYKSAMEKNKVLEMLAESKDKLFDSVLVEHFIEVMKD